jgi:hypothetical protein
MGVITHRCADLVEPGEYKMSMYSEQLTLTLHD